MRMKGSTSPIWVWPIRSASRSEIDAPQQLPLQSAGLFHAVMARFRCGPQGVRTTAQRMTPYLTTPPVRATLYWQAGATLIGALVAGIWLGYDGAISAALGGLIILLSCIAYAIVISVSNSPSRSSIFSLAISAQRAGHGKVV